MSALALQAARDNSVFLIEQALEKGIDRPQHAASAYFTITRAYRRLAIVALLADLDVDRFRDHLCRSAFAYLDFLQRQRAGLKAEGRYRCASNATAFDDALAAGVIDEAREIAAAFGDKHEDGVEYEDDFLRERVQHKLLLGAPAKEVEALLARWTKVVERKPAVFLDVERALATRNAADFERSFDALIERRDAVLVEWRKMPNYREDAGVTEGTVFVESLALLRLAEQGGIATRGEYKYAPAVARIALGPPKPARDSWRTPNA